jgi:hypothetical protein
VQGLNEHISQLKRISLTYNVAPVDLSPYSAFRVGGDLFVAPAWPLLQDLGFGHWTHSDLHARLSGSIVQFQGVVAVSATVLSTFCVQTGHAVDLLSLPKDTTTYRSLVRSFISWYHQPWLKADHPLLAHLACVFADNTNLVLESSVLALFGLQRLPNIDRFYEAGAEIRANIGISSLVSTMLGTSSLSAQAEASAAIGWSAFATQQAMSSRAETGSCATLALCLRFVCRFVRLFAT